MYFVAAGFCIACLQQSDKVEFRLCECKAGKRKPFSDGKFTKSCLNRLPVIFMEYACLEKNIWWRKPVFPALLFDAGQMIFQITSNKL